MFSWGNGLWVGVQDAGNINSSETDQAQDWAAISNDRTCNNGSCDFEACASRPLVTPDSNDFDLPLKDEANMRVYFYAGDLTGFTTEFVSMGAWSLGVAMATAVGSALVFL